MPNWQDVIKRANTDPPFRDRLKANPLAACKEAGADVPAGTTVEVIEEDRDELHLFLGTQTQDPAVNRVLERAESDAAFRQQLLANPSATLEAATGEKLPAGVKLYVHKPTANRVRLLLSASKETAGELSDEQLEAVAGGTRFAEIWSNIRDFCCRDQPIALTVENKGSIVTGVGVITTRSGNIDSADRGVQIQ